MIDGEAYQEPTDERLSLVTTMEARMAWQLHTQVDAALQYAYRFAGSDGADHKMWVIDQMVRCLTGCPLATVIDNDGDPVYELVGVSADYELWVDAAKSGGTDNPDEYDWETGTAP